MAQADCSSGQASAAPEPSPKRKPRRSSGTACKCSSNKAWPRSPEQWAKMQRSSTVACNAAATSTALLVIKPSTTMTRFSRAACSTLPTMVAISSPPRAASASSGACAWACFSKTCAKICVLRLMALGFKPVPAPVQSPMGKSHSRAINSDAAEVLPMPISPSNRVLPGSSWTSCAPLRRACWHCAVLMAACCKLSALP